MYEITARDGLILLEHQGKFLEINAKEAYEVGVDLIKAALDELSPIPSTELEE